MVGLAQKRKMDKIQSTKISFHTQKKNILQIYSCKIQTPCTCSFVLQLHKKVRHKKQKTKTAQFSQNYWTARFLSLHMILLKWHNAKEKTKIRIKLFSLSFLLLCRTYIYFYNRLSRKRLWRTTYHKTICSHTFHNSSASEKTTTKRTIWNYSNAKLPVCDNIEQNNWHKLELL